MSKVGEYKYKIEECLPQSSDIEIKSLYKDAKGIYSLLEMVKYYISKEHNYLVNCIMVDMLTFTKLSKYKFERIEEIGFDMVIPGVFNPFDQGYVPEKYKNKILIVAFYNENFLEKPFSPNETKTFEFVGEL